MTLDPEMLAAYIDKRLTPEQRAAVEAQLASDPDSYALLVESIKALDALQVQERVTPFVVKSRPSMERWTVAAGVLAAAAALLLVVVQPDWVQRLRGNRIDPRLERLVAAVGDERYVEGRLTGGFKYGPLHVVTRGTGSPQNLELVAAAGTLQKTVQSSAAASDLHAWGIAQLLLGDFDGAIRTLQQVTVQEPSEALFQSDLSSALLARARMADRPDDLAPALAAAERALELDPDLVEAKFNRALALESLRRDDQAAEAWQAYLAADAASAWSAEARRHLRRPR